MDAPLIEKRDAYLLSHAIIVHLYSVARARNDNSDAALLDRILKANVMRSLLRFGPINLALMAETKKIYVEAMNFFLPEP